MQEVSLALALPPSLPGQATLSYLSDFLMFFHHHPAILLRTQGPSYIKKNNKLRATFRASNKCFPGPRPRTIDGSQACTRPGTGKKKRRVPGEERPFPVLICPQGTGESLRVVLEHAAVPCSKLSFTQRETGYTIWWTKEDCLVL